MKMTMVRFIVAGLIMASLGFLIYYYFAAPDDALSTYNEITTLAYSDEYLDFDENVTIMNNSLNLAGISGAELNNYYGVVNIALTNNFNHYKSYLLFVNQISAGDQATINDKVAQYKTAFLETNRLLIHFNNDLVSNNATKANMHSNFITSYNATIRLYVELIEAMQDYVIKYSFNNNLPIGLKQTLLQVQLDFAKVVIDEQLEILTDATIINELNDIILKYNNFNNEPQGNNFNAQLFVEAYANVSNAGKENYYKNEEKFNYVDQSNDLGEEGDLVRIIHAFLTLPSYNEVI